MSPICKKTRPQKRRRTANLRSQVLYVTEDFCVKSGSDAAGTSKNSQVDKTNPTLDTFFEQQKQERQNELQNLATRDLIQRETLSNLSRVLRRRLQAAVNECSEEILQSHRALSRRSSPGVSIAEGLESGSAQSEVPLLNLCFTDEETSQTITNNENSGNEAENNAVSVWDTFFERQRLERRNEVDTLAGVSHITRDRTFLITTMLRERLTSSNDRDLTPARNELSSLRNSQRVQNLLSDSFRQRLERVLSNRNSRHLIQNVNIAVSAAQTNGGSRTAIVRPVAGLLHNGPPTPPPPPPITPAPEAIARNFPRPVRMNVHHPPPPPVFAHPPPPGPPPLGLINYTNQTPSPPSAQNLVRNDRFDDLAELGNLVGSQVVSRVLNSTFADILERHLIDRMESDPDTFSLEARREVQRTLDNLPRTRRVRNDFRDAGIDPDGLPRLLENDIFGNDFEPEMPLGPPPVPGMRRNASERTEPAGDYRMSRLETMMEAMQNMMTRQNSAQLQMENALQQLVLNQSLLASQPNANVRMISERGGTCVVCLDETQEVNSAFYKCGHMIACNQCASILLAINPMCPLCRQPILDVIKLYRVENSSTP